MTGVVSSTVTRTQASSTSPQGNTGGLAGNGEGKGDRFRDLLSKLTGVTGSDVKAAGTVPQGEARPEPSRSAAAWKLQLGMARGDVAGESASGNDPAMAQPPVVQNTARAQDAATAQQLTANGEESSDNIASNPLLAELLGAAEATDELDASDDSTSAQEHPSVTLKDMLEATSGASAPPPLGRDQASPATSSQPTGAGNPVALSTDTSAEMKVEAEVAGTSSGEGPRKAAPILIKPAPESTSVPHDNSDAIGSAPTGLSTDQAKSASEAGKAATQTEDAALMRETKLAVVRNETHFAPVPQLSPMLQIAERIKSEIGSSPAVAPALADRGFTYAQPSEPVLKILHIHLEPADLGAVTVRMSLKDDALELRLDVSQQATAHVIQKDHETLSTALRSAGYLVDGVTVQIVELDKTQGASTQSNPQNAQASLQSSAQSASGESQANAGSGRGQTSAQGRSGTSSTQQDAGQSSSGRTAGAGGVYV